MEPIISEKAKAQKGDIIKQDPDELKKLKNERI